MLRYKCFHFLCYFAAFVALWGCARKIDLDIPYTPSLVLIGHFKPNKPFVVSVGTNSSVFSNEPAFYPKDVALTITSPNGNVEELRPDLNLTDAWKSVLKPVIGETYTIEAALEGYPTIRATSSIPQPVRLNQVLHGPITENQISGNQSEMRIPLTLSPVDMAVGDKYFAFNIRYQFFQADETRENKASFLADGRTVSLIYNTPADVVLIDKNFWTGVEGEPIQLEVVIPFDPAIQKMSKVLVEWRTLSPEFYKYHLSLARQSGLGNIFDDPDVLFNNIEGGLGNFSGYSVLNYSVDLP